jgi:hypothetical protein
VCSSDLGSKKLIQISSLLFFSELDN